MLCLVSEKMYRKQKLNWLEIGCLLFDFPKNHKFHAIVLCIIVLEKKKNILLCCGYLSVSYNEKNGNKIGIWSLRAKYAVSSGTKRKHATVS